MIRQGNRSRRSGHASTTTNDWYHALGQSHRTRKASADREWRTRHDGEQDKEWETRRRWPGIADALSSIISRYNDGAGSEVLTVASGGAADGSDLAVTIVSNGGLALTVSVSGADLCVSLNPAPHGAPDDGRRWLPLAAADHAVAAYALQDWLTHL